MAITLCVKPQYNMYIGHMHAFDLPGFAALRITICNVQHGAYFAVVRVQGSGLCAVILSVYAVLEVSVLPYNGGEIPH